MIKLYKRFEDYMHDEDESRAVFRGMLAVSIAIITMCIVMGVQLMTMNY